MSKADNTESILLDYVSRELIDSRQETSLAADDDLLGSGLVDSLGVMRLIRFLEERYGVTVPPADVTIDNFMTVSAITTYLQSLRASVGSDG